MTESKLLHKIEQLNRIGIALSEPGEEIDLLERILLGAKALTDSDGGTLYLLNQQDELEFRLMFTDSLDLARGGRQGEAIDLAPLELFDDQGQPRNHLIAVRAASAGEVVRVDDTYAATGYDFSGAHEFDRRLGYRTEAVLAVPMRNHEQEIIGVIQLINPGAGEGKIRPFSDEDLAFCRSLASQAAIALTKGRLIGELEALFDALIRMIATTIDEKSEFTGGHCRRVPVVTDMIADALSTAESGPFASVDFDPPQRRELELAAWLHDCGKLSTPDHIIDKHTKLEGIIDGFKLVETRVAVVRAELLGRSEEARLEELLLDLEFLRSCNAGGEYLGPEQQQRIRAISEGYCWHDQNGQPRPLLSEDEIANLQIDRGTLNEDERTIIKNHILVTRKILSTLPFPKRLQKVPQIASRHHEQLNGQGYPDGLSGAELELPDRILAIADIFESLVANDRPYRPPKQLSEARGILEKLAAHGAIDGDILQQFISSGAMHRYAESFLDSEQIDC